MKSNKGVKLSEVLVCLMMLLIGFAVGMNVGSQLFTERPDFITWILTGVMVIGGILVPFVRKKEKENKK